MITPGVQIALGALCATMFFAGVPRILARLGPPGAPSVVLVRRALGCVLLGGVPLLLTAREGAGAVARAGLQRGDSILAWCVASVGCLAAVFAMRHAAHRGLLANQPELRPPRWSGRTHAVNAASWAAYLLGYEFFFRGFLLLSLLTSLGVGVAVGVSALSYLLAHAGQSRAEIMGALLMTPLFTGLTLAGASVLPAALVHLAIALSADAFAVRSRISECS